MAKLGSLLSAAYVALALGGCTQQIDQDVDCHNICNRYQSCWDSNYDTQACHDRCVAYVRSDASMASRAANDCDTCLGGRSCTGSVFPCAVECAPLLP